MRKKYLLFLCMTLTCFHLGAQNSNFSSKKTQETDSTTWQKQLDFCKMASLKINSLKLIGYNYLGEITSNEQVDKCWERLLADETRIIMFPNDGDYETFDIVPLKQERERIWNLYKKDLAEGYRNSLEPVVTLGSELIELEWEYNGEKINSLGIISNGKIVFDHIGSGVLLPGTTVSKAKPVIGERVYESEEEALRRIKELDSIANSMK